MHDVTYPLPRLMVDVVLLTLQHGELRVGLLQRLNPDEPYPLSWALPGGQVHVDEDDDADATARRVLADKAGVLSPYLEQLATFSGRVRDPRGWSASIAYYALVPEHVTLASSGQLRWFDVASVPALPFDHNRILETALSRVRSKTTYSALPVHLMPPTFTLSQLREVYERLLGGPLEPRGFARRMAELDILDDTGLTWTEGGRPARLYRHKAQRGLAQLGSSIVPLTGTSRR